MSIKSERKEHINFTMRFASSVMYGPERKDGIMDGYKQASIISVIFYVLKKSEANLANDNIY